MDHGVLVGVFGRLPFSQSSQGDTQIVPGLVEFGVNGRGDFKISLNPDDEVNRCGPRHGPKMENYKK